MAKKGSKNAVENRGVQTKIICPVCKKEKKPIAVWNYKKRIGFGCDCGIFSKSGGKLTGSL